MSSVYHTEPPTSGKVIIRTSYGDIDIELWTREAPLACRNFIQLALEGYYDRTKVIRVVKGFMVQMGDPTGTGTGGESIWGKPFKDEVHGRIKFNHRGQVAMANSNKPNSNQSQFFVTLDSCDWLYGKHSIFGKVTGSTFFNVMKMGEVDVDNEEKPLEPIHIISVEVVLNPFNDIVPRSIVRKTSSTSDIPSKESSAHDKIKATRNLNLLSFGDEEVEDGEIQVRFRSVHDAKKRRVRESNQAKLNLNNNTNDDGKPTERPEEEDKNFDRHMKEQILEKLRQEKSASLTKNVAEKTQDKRKSLEEDEDDTFLNPELLVQSLESEKKRKLMLEKNQEFRRLREELLGASQKAVKVITGEEAVERNKKEAYHELATPLEARRLKYLKRKNEHGDRSEDTLHKLMKFTENIRSKKSEFSKENDTDKQRQVESYHGQILEEDEARKDDLDDWFVGKLKCKKHIDEQYRS